MATPTNSKEQRGRFYLLIIVIVIFLLGAVALNQHYAKKTSTVPARISTAASATPKASPSATLAPTAASSSATPTVASTSGTYKSYPTNVQPHR